MKKILSVVLLLAMCLSLFAGCAKEDNSAAALESAKDYMEAAYKDEEAVTGTEYQRGGVLLLEIDGVKHEFKVTWTTNNDKVKVVAGEGKMVTIAVPYDNLEDVSYTLTATVSDAKGNSFQMSFDRTVPARPGIPTNVEDGTYVIVVDGKSYTSLTEDKSYGYNVFHEVTVENGTVSGHYKADIITITNVDGGFTMQDAYGRYIFMKDSHNSCNVSKEAPEEGHIWQLLTDKDGNTFIINTLKMKILAFDTAYSSWGAYPEITDARLSKIQMIKATAPETDPEPETPDVPEKPADKVVFVDQPAADTAYKFVMQQNGITGSPMLGATGAMSGYYFATSEAIAEMVDFYLEAVDGGYHIYYMNGDVKTYVNIVPRDNDATKTNIKYQTIEENAAPSVYTLNYEFKYVYTTVNDVAWYIGTYGDKNTFSASNVSYIEDTSKIGVSQFCAWFAAADEATETPSNTVVFVDQPAADTAYKFVMQQNGITGSPMLGATGAMSGYYFATSEAIAEMVDFYLEAVDGGYHIYYMNGDVKTYVNIVPRDNDATKTNIKYQTIEENAAPSVYTLNYEFKYVYTTVNDVAWYIGTYGDKNTFSASNVSYIEDTSKIGVSQFCAWFAIVGEATEEPEQPEQPEEPETPVVTGTATLADQVAVGDKIVLVNAAGDSAMGAQKEKMRDVVAITVTDGTANLTADVVIITLEAGSQEGTFALKVADGYLAYANNGNAISTQETVDDAASWTITIVDGVVTIQNVAYAERFLQYNASNPRFVCYKESSQQQAPVIYKVEE